MADTDTQRAKPAETIDITTPHRDDGDTESRPAADSETWDLTLRLDDDCELSYALVVGEEVAFHHWGDDVDAEIVAIVLGGCSQKLREWGFEEEARRVWEVADPLWRLNPHLGEPEEARVTGNPSGMREHAEPPPVRGLRPPDRDQDPQAQAPRRDRASGRAPLPPVRPQRALAVRRVRAAQEQFPRVVA